MSAAPIRAYWWRPPSGGYTNVGDEIGPMVLTALGYRIERVPIDRAEILPGGSIVEGASFLPAVVWGAGVATDRQLPGPVHAIAVRGPLTARRVGTGPEIPCGDPGLLAGLFWPGGRRKRYDVGVVRHFVDEHPYPDADIVIDCTEEPFEVLAKIAACRTILSSSLHGLILARAYGISSMRIWHPDVAFGNTKWIDAGAAFGRPIEEVQEGLLGALHGWASTRAEQPTLPVLPTT